MTTRNRYKQQTNNRIQRNHQNVEPAIHLLDQVYEKGVSLTKQAFKTIEQRLQRHEHLPKYHVVIQPTPA